MFGREEGWIVTPVITTSLIFIEERAEKRTFCCGLLRVLDL
jgi:hypothetical protein